MILKHIFSCLLFLHCSNYASQPDFSLVPDATMYPLTDADFIILTLALREKFDVSQRTYFVIQPSELFKDKKDNPQKKPCVPIEDFFYPVKNNIEDKFYRPGRSLQKK